MRIARFAAKALLILPLAGFPALADSTGFSFSLHVLPWFPGSGSLTEALSPADVDRDGDMDFFTGQSEGTDWFENLGITGWRRHALNDSANTDVGAFALDVDGDGWIDRVSGSFWHRNPGTSGGGYRAIRYGLFKNVHDLYHADMDGDGRWDVVTLEYTKMYWLRRPADPAAASALWDVHTINEGADYAGQHGGLALGDIDGDGDTDVARMDRWYENPGNGAGTWAEHVNIGFGREGPWGLSGRALLLDLDGDGALDLFQAECDLRNGRFAWFRNRGGKGGDWVRQILKDSVDGQDFHSLVAADFDGDGDDDIFSMGGTYGSGRTDASPAPAFSCVARRGPSSRAFSRDIGLGACYSRAPGA